MGMAEWRSAVVHGLLPFTVAGLACKNPYDGLDGVFFLVNMNSLSFAAFSLIMGR